MISRIINRCKKTCYSFVSPKRPRPNPYAVLKSEMKDLYFSCLRSKLAYMSTQEIQKVMENPHHEVSVALTNLKEPPIYYDGNETAGVDAQAIMLCCEDTVFISFRGTDKPKDLLWNLNFFTTDFLSDKKLKVHMGFSEQFFAIEPSITNDISKREFTNIYFEGHSLGGALATLAALFYSNKFKGTNKKIKCITFGSPRVGNKDFVTKFHNDVPNSYRVVNDDDAVVQLPFHDEYIHVGNCIQFDESGWNLKLWRNDILLWYVRLWALLFLGNIYEHNISAYLSKLKAYSEFETSLE